MNALPNRLFHGARSIVIAGMVGTLMLPSLAAWSQGVRLTDSMLLQGTGSAPAASQPQPQQQMDVGELIKSLKSDLLKAQKQAYDRELEINKLKKQLESQQGGEKNTQSSNPWVEVNLSGTAENNGLQPAVATPDALKTSLQYYKHQYFLKPGDKLSINFLGEDPNRVTSQENTNEDVSATFLQQVTVLTDGTIVLPPFGILQVDGKTLKQVNDELNREIGNYYKFAVVTVSLSEAAPDDIVVLGQVKKQGHIKVPVGTTLSQLFKEVGGVSEKADISHIFIRKKVDGMVYMADLSAFLQEGDIGQDMIMQSGDVVVIPEGQTDISYELYKNTDLLPKEFQVSVLGPASKPGFYTAKPGDTVASMIARAEGLQPFARNSKILLVREDKAAKTFKTLEFRMKDFVDAERNAEVNIALRPNDLIMVKDSTFKRSLERFSQFVPNSLSLFLSQAAFYRFIRNDGSN